VVAPVALDRPPSLTDAVVAHIRDGIISGGYAPGRPLIEARLAEELGTSRGTVREALRELASLGLVTRTTYRGAVVSTLSPRRAEEVYTLRATLESLAARLAVERGTLDAAALSHLAGHVEAIARAGASGDVPGMIVADMDFHTALSALSRHDLLMEHIAAIRVHSQRLLSYIDFYQPHPEVVVQRHRDLLAILRSGDADRVAAAVEDHIAGPGRDIVARMKQAGAASGEGSA
jgi:DNA-binding GntR family transcriptional regulator